MRRGERKVYPYESPQGRRVNVLAAVAVDGPALTLHWVSYAGTWKAKHLVRMLEELSETPVDGLPTVVVLDNASIHHARLVHDALPALAERGLTVYFLPPYSPKLNAIERVFRAIKYTDLPERRYPTLDALLTAVDQAFRQYDHKLLAKQTHQPGLAA